MKKKPLTKLKLIWCLWIQVAPQKCSSHSTSSNINLDSLTTTYMLANCELNCLSFLFLFQNDKRLMSLLINEAEGERVTIPCSFVAFVLHNGLQNDHRNYSLLTALSNCYSRQFSCCMILIGNIIIWFTYMFSAMIFEISSLRFLWKFSDGRERTLIC